MGLGEFRRLTGEVFEEMKSDVSSVGLRLVPVGGRQHPAMHSHLSRFFMHETRLVFQSEAMERGNGRITADERSDMGMSE